MCFKNLEGKLKIENPKRTISTNSGSETLQMVSEPDTRRCASKEAEPRREVDMRWWGVDMRCPKMTISASGEFGLLYLVWVRPRDSQQSLSWKLVHRGKSNI